MTQLQGVYGNIYTDMIAVIEFQNDNALNSTFSNNDISESVNAASKRQQRRAPNISSDSREGFCLNSINGDAWKTFD